MFRKQLIILRAANPVAVDFIVAYGIRLLTAGVAGVTFYGIDDAVFDFFDNAYMVRDAVLTAFVGVVPIEKDDVTGVGSIGVILPLVTGFEPVLACVADCKAGNNTAFKVSTFIGTPTDKDCTPIYSLVETVPSLAGFPTYIVFSREHYI